MRSLHSLILLVLSCGCDAYHAYGSTPPDGIASAHRIIQIGFKLNRDSVGRLGRIHWGLEYTACQDECTRLVPVGEEIVLTVVPDTSADFIGWSGLCKGQGPTCRFRTDTNTQVAAELLRIGPAIDLTNFDKDLGAIVSNPPGISCGLGESKCAARFPLNSKVQLIARTGAPNYLSFWSAPCTEANRRTCAVTLTNETVVISAGFNVCSAPNTLCGGECVDVKADPRHCGRCCNACAGADGGQYQCMNGSCTCPVGKTCTRQPAICSGETDCGGCGCATLSTNSLNCGTCGTTCKLGQSCSGGSCK